MPSCRQRKRLPQAGAGAWAGLIVALWVAATAAPDAGAAEPPTFDAAEIAFFEEKVRPLLEARCGQCHGAEAQAPKGGLRIASREALLQGGESGPAVTPGNPDDSLLIEAIRYESFEMPPRSRMPEGEIDILVRWVEMGAPWPPGETEPPPVADSRFPLEDRRDSHWAWRPLQAPSPPTVRDTAWARDPVDRFLLARMEAHGVSPAAPADRGTLLRRVSFALTGLPPTRAELDEFLADPAPTAAAYEKVVDRLLESPHFGERWGRHWLDLVRYAETRGHEFDYPIPHAHQYRDYVIRAFNADLPYGQFVREHVAGDLLPEPRRHPAEGFNESILGTGFWTLGEAKHAPVDVRAEEAELIDNQIDVFSKTFLGLTVSCARCHDHKFDAISTKDYYALAGILKSSRRQTALLDPQDRIGGVVAALEELRLQGDAVIAGAVSPVASPPETSPAGAAGHGAAPSTGGDSPPPTVLFEDFSGERYDGWFATGWAFGESPTRRGEWDALSERPAALLPGVAHSGRLAKGLPGVLRSRSFTITHPQILYRVAGEGGKVRLVIDGYFMDGFNALLFNGASFDVNTEGQFVWHRQAQDVSRYVGHRAYIELIDDGDGWLAVDEIWFTDGTAKPQRPSGRPELSVALESVSPDSEATLAELSHRMARLAGQLPEPMRAPALTDGTGEDERVFIRGSHRNLGDPVPRRFLEAVAGPDQPPVAAGSGRRELAERMLDPSNPFPARVMVNRVWHHLFGRGIVESTDDFGVLGTEPTHPELLDHLALRFREDGWSVKRLIRALVLSSAYQMSSMPDPAAEDRDPENRLWHRMPIRRLEGEAIRDAILRISGRLDPAAYGASVPVHLTPFMQGRGRPAGGPLDGDGRRSIYVSVNRNFLSPMMLAFDTPIPFTTIGRRNVSNVPAQALILLNDPFVVQQAEVWARRVLSQEALNPERRIAELYRDAFSRPPTEAEIEEALRFLRSQAAAHGLPQDRWRDDPRVWSDLCHVLWNLKEFIFVN